MKNIGTSVGASNSVKDLLVHTKWPWHLLFWVGYILFRSWAYYITIEYYPRVFLEYMLMTEVVMVGITYLTLFLYRKFFGRQKFVSYFLVGIALWTAYLYFRTLFQFYYLQDAPGFKSNTFTAIFLNNIAVVVVYFLFITTCKYFKDGYIAQHFESVRKEQQLMAEVNNLKSQIAPHFLFNTLNNLYGLAVEKSAMLPDLMLRLSDILRHSLYETQKSYVPIHKELSVLKSYVELERIRLENNFELMFEDAVPKNTSYEIAPLILIVFVENAFKHVKYVQTEPPNISISTSLESDWFFMTIRNNYNKDQQGSTNGIGLINVRRRIEVLYPQHHLQINKGDEFYTVNLRLPLVKSIINND